MIRWSLPRCADYGNGRSTPSLNRQIADARSPSAPSFPSLSSFLPSHSLLGVGWREELARRGRDRLPGHWARFSSARLLFFFRPLCPWPAWCRACACCLSGSWWVTSSCIRLYRRRSSCRSLRWSTRSAARTLAPRPAPAHGSPSGAATCVSQHTVLGAFIGLSLVYFVLLLPLYSLAVDESM